MKTSLKEIMIFLSSFPVLIIFFYTNFPYLKKGMKAFYNTLTL